MPKRIYRRKIYEKEERKSIIFPVFKFLFLCFLTLGLISALAGFVLLIYYSKDLPRPEKFTEKSFIQSTEILDRTGENILYELYGEEKRDIVALDEISQNLKNAVIATEDAKFYSHHGLDFGGILRSILVNLRIRKPLYGGSTISQQLIRSSFFNTEKTIERKVREIVLTIELERRYSKEQILEWYLNQIPLGPNIYGAETAAKTYFNKKAKDLSLEESAVLAALIKAPTYLSPYRSHLEELLARKDYVLDRMYQEKYITEQELEAAKNQEIKFNEITQYIKAPHFVIYVEDYLFEKYGKNFLEQQGLKIYTTLDWELQQEAEKIVQQGVKNNKYLNANNAALVALDPKTGQILAMTGSADWFGKPLPEGCMPGKDCLFDPKVNIATLKIGRQPGSAFKPFVYATAFQKGYDDKVVVIDEETNFGVFGGKEYIPQNYDGLFRGPVTLRQALAQSLNVPSVKVLVDLAGLEDSLATARKLGITTLNRPSSFYGPSIVLGGGEVNLLDMVSGYSVFATEGLKVPPVSILKIEDSDGNIIEQNHKTPKKVLDTESARLINNILSDNEARAPMFGSFSSMYFKDYEVAAKTGTTSNYRDAWIIGYTPSLSVGVWSGNNNNEAMAEKPSVTIAGPIWRAFMEKALPEFPKQNFTPPKSVLESNSE